MKSQNRSIGYIWTFYLLSTKKKKTIRTTNAAEKFLSYVTHMSQFSHYFSRMSWLVRKRPLSVT